MAVDHHWYGQLDWDRTNHPEMGADWLLVGDAHLNLRRLDLDGGSPRGDDHRVGPDLVCGAGVQHDLDAVGQVLDVVDLQEALNLGLLEEADEFDQDGADLRGQRGQLLGLLGLGHGGILSGLWPDTREPLCARGWEMAGRAAL
jgi:hypothetical protein